jgi:hypothetical protein
MFPPGYPDGFAAFQLFSAEGAEDDSRPGRFLIDGDERPIVKRKLSAIEQVAEMNIAYFVRLEGRFSLDQLRSALDRVQGKHPVLRGLIRKEGAGLYYEENSAPEIPLRIVARISEEDSWHVCQTELTTVFAEDKPQLRVVWLQSEWENDLLLTTSHRICDPMSMFTIVQEVLRSLHSDEELIPYAPITTQDIIGSYQPLQPWKSKLTARLVNGLLRLIPHSRHKPDNKEYHLEWKAERPLLAVLKQRCKVEGVSVHAVLTATLERALFAVFGRERAPKWIINPIDLRRGRFAALTSDKVFYGGGNFKINTSTAADMEFWARVRAVHQEIRKEIDREIRDIPGRFYLIQLVHPPTSGQIQSIVRLGDALKFNSRWNRFGLSHLGNGSWNRFGLSNLGNIVINDSDSPFRVKDLRLYIHSFNIRTLGLIPYTVNGEMRFYCVSDEKCLRPDQVDALKHEFMIILDEQLTRPADGGGIRSDVQCHCDMPTADGVARNVSSSVLVTGDKS